MKTQQKLFTIIFSFSLVLVVSIVLLMQWSINKGMVDYVNKQEIKALTPLITSLTGIYQQQHNWQSLQNDHRKFQRLLRDNLQNSVLSISAPRPRFQRPERPLRKRRARFNAPEHPRVDKQRPPLGNRAFIANRPPPMVNDEPPPKPRRSFALLTTNKTYIVGDYPNDLHFSFVEINLDDTLIGYLAFSSQDKLLSGYEFDFVQQQQQYLWYLAVGLLILVLMIVFPLARHVLLPLKQLTKAVHQLAQGRYQQEMDLKRKDEFGDLSRDFNDLANNLAQNEIARKRWLANTSHELRTPVAILRGELEAVIDGVRPLSMATITSVHQETLHLQKLITDLHELTSAEIGAMSHKLEPLNLVELLTNEYKKHQVFLTQAGLNSELIINNPNQGEIKVNADQTRLCQLLDNLINNAIKYAAEGCFVQIILTKNELTKQAILTIADNGVGVEEQHLTHLFEYLYRTDDSRNRKTGGSGLGLAICAQIVKQHQGSICAKKAELGGLEITIKLPLH